MTTPDPDSSNFGIIIINSFISHYTEWTIIYIYIYNCPLVYIYNDLLYNGRLLITISFILLLHNICYSKIFLKTQNVDIYIWIENRMSWVKASQLYQKLLLNQSITWTLTASNIIDFRCVYIICMYMYHCRVYVRSRDLMFSNVQCTVNINNDLNTYFP